MAVAFFLTLEMRGRFELLLFYLPLTSFIA